VIENLEGASDYSGSLRLPYVKPFVRNLDLSETEGKTIKSSAEQTYDNSIFKLDLGPS